MAKQRLSQNFATPRVYLSMIIIDHLIKKRRTEKIREKDPLYKTLQLRACIFKLKHLNKDSHTA
jgi:hypothetical protein